MRGPKTKQIQMAANGAIIYRDASGNTVELAPGSVGQVLTMAGGVPTWATPAAASVDPVEIWQYSLMNRGGV